MPGMTKALTVRLPKSTHTAVSAIARRRHTSLNRVVQESLEATLKAERDRRLYEEFGLLAEDAEITDVSYALAAQEEVMLRDES